MSWFVKPYSRADASVWLQNMFSDEMQAVTWNSLQTAWCPHEVAHDLPTASYPPLPKAWSDNKISISTFSKSLWMGSLKRLKLPPQHTTFARRWSSGADWQVCLVAPLFL